MNRVSRLAPLLLLLWTLVLLTYCAVHREPTPNLPTADRRPQTTDHRLPTADHQSDAPTRTRDSMGNMRIGASPPTADLPTIFIAEGISGTLRAALLDAAKQLGLNPAQTRGSAALVVSPLAAPLAQPLTERVYVVAARFASPREGIGSEELVDLWQGKATADGITTLVLSPATAAAFTAWWGAPAANVRAIPEKELAARLWQDHHALAFVPFDALTPNLKALPVDGLDVLDREANLDPYPLIIRTFVTGDAVFAKGLAALLARNKLLTNRDPQRITRLIMTGVTAISRTSALKIDQSGDPALPARKVAEVLAAADLTHVSNEVPFTEACKPVLGTLQLCSKPQYIETLKLAGVDLIGSTGNHLLDYGVKAFLDTLDLFEANGFQVYGGGRNLEEASRILYVQDHGNRLAFLGMNSFGPKSVWATKERPGAQKYDTETLRRELEEARQKADLVFLDMQADETYEYRPNANNRALFRAALQAGADVVTGVQAHQPQAIEFTPDGKKLILYGLGNLFFDQMQNADVRAGLVVRHTIYEGRLLQTELLPTLLEDYVQPRWATPQERQAILKRVFEASDLD